MKTTTEDTKNIIFLNMTGATASAVIAARPELKELKKAGFTKIICRKLGDRGNPEIKTLEEAELSGACVVSFNVPVNIAAKADRVIEIPVSKAIERKKLGDSLQPDEMTLLTKGLTDFIRMPLRAFITKQVALSDAPAEEGEEDIAF